MNSLRLLHHGSRYVVPSMGCRLYHSSQITRNLPRTLSCYRAFLAPSRPCFAQTKRLFSVAAPAKHEVETHQETESKDRWANTPAYEMTFTCTQCKTRSTHKLSKQGYHHGTILVTCPGCKNRHLIADHLKIFSDKRVTLEDIMKDKGQLIKKGSLSAEGDVEFWDDGSETTHAPQSDEIKKLA